MSLIDRPDSAELRTMSAFRYEIALLDSKISNTENDSDKQLYTTVKDYMQSRVESIQKRL